MSINDPLMSTTELKRSGLCVHNVRALCRNFVFFFLYDPSSSITGGIKLSEVSRYVDSQQRPSEKLPVTEVEENWMMRVF